MKIIFVDECIWVSICYHTDLLTFKILNIDVVGLSTHYTEQVRLKSCVLNVCGGDLKSFFAQFFPLSFLDESVIYKRSQFVISAFP